MDAMNLEQKQREEARWRILRVLDAGRPIAVSETIVWRVLKAYVPLFYLRHAYPLSLTLTLLVVILSAFGLRRLVPWR